jgi:hypothetical protein
MRECICGHCGVRFMRRLGKRNKGLFCSRACAFKASPQFSGQKMLGPYKKDWVKAGGRAPGPVVECAECGSAFEKRRTSKVCSDKCRVARFNRQCNDNSKQRYYTKYPPRVLSLTCAYCGKGFEKLLYKGSGPKYCSSKCSVNAVGCAGATKARKKGAVVDYALNPIAVFARDGWRCRLCGVATPRRLRGTNAPNAPELDHIVPTSKGGNHTADNVQCACRQCNGSKGDKAMGQPGLAFYPTAKASVTGSVLCR